ncbi:CAP domain-containing protein [Rhodobacteraceae bacterium SC52]|nr:CAP domain-containing protein [Rhodobacteraceae bacterium SC52]
MLRISGVLTVLLLGLGACAPQSGPLVSSAGVYSIRSGDVADIQYRMLDSVNALRAGAGVAPVELDARLTAAAETHARDMSRQQRAWPFGSDGSSPYDRIGRSGYQGTLVAELYAQTFETELDTLAAWIDDGAWGEEILSPDATDMGFSWKQDNTGLLWWVILLGDGSTLAVTPAF